VIRGRVGIVTDSATALPASVQSKFGVTVIPLHLSIDDEVFSEGVNISPPKVVSALLDKKVVKIFEPPAAEFARAYRDLAQAGVQHIVSIHVSSKMQKVVAHATEAAAQSPVPVTVIDSGSVSMGTGFAVMAAAARAAEDESPERVAEAARTTATSSRVMMTVETMEYVHRDGQVPGAVRAFADTMHVRPLLTIKDGVIARAGGARNTTPARNEVRRQIEDYISTLPNPAVSVALAGGSAVEAGLGVTTAGLMIEASPGASLTAHTGPGTYVVCAANLPADFPRAD